MCVCVSERPSVRLLFGAANASVACMCARSRYSLALPLCTVTVSVCARAAVSRTRAQASARHLAAGGAHAGGAARALLAGERSCAQSARRRRLDRPLARPTSALRNGHTTAPTHKDLLLALGGGASRTLERAPQARPRRIPATRAPRRAH